MLFVASVENLKILNMIYFQKNISLVFSIICSRCENEDEKIFKEEESFEITNTLVYTSNYILYILLYIQ